MYILKTSASLSNEKREALRKSFKDRTGEDCIVLDCGVTLERIKMKEANTMADRTIETKVILTGEEEYVAGLERIAAALRSVGEAKKELDALFNKTPNPGQNQTSSSSAPQ